LAGDKLTTRLGWTHEQYLTWLSRSLADLLFRDPDSPGAESETSTP
jgi:hypothetical protein